MPKTTTTARRKRRSQEELTALILQAATAEFHALGFAGATTAQIAARADVTETQLFRYFGSKANLFHEAIFKPLDQQLAGFIGAHMAEADVGAVREATSLYIDELQAFVRTNQAMLTSLIAAQTYDREAAQGLASVGSLAAYFDRGASMMASRLTGPAGIDPKLMVRVSFAAVLACVIFKDWIFPPGLASDGAIREAINGFVREGLTATAELGAIRE